MNLEHQNLFMYGNGNNYLCRILQKMNYIPEGLTPYEIDINPQLLQLWSLSIATKNLTSCRHVYSYGRTSNGSLIFKFNKNCLSNTQIKTFTFLNY